MRQPRASVAGQKCAICDERAAVDMDHVPPRSIFPRPWPGDLITVPACDECNGGSSLNDEEFKVGLSLMAGADRADTLALWEQGAMRSLAHNRRLHREVLRRIVKVEVRSAGGIYLGTEDVALIPKRPVHAVIVRTIRGLYYHHFRERLGARAHCDAKNYEGVGRNDVELNRVLRSFRFNSIANGRFKYFFGRAADGPLTSVWLMLFFGNVAVLGYTKAAGDDWTPDGESVAGKGQKQR